GGGGTGLWGVLAADLRHARATQCRAEWWNLWKRVAGGLNARQQQHLQQLVSPALLRKGKPKGPRPGPQEMREMWQAVGSCERLQAHARSDLADEVATAAARGRTTDQELWALARLGARVPIYGPLNCVVPRERAAVPAARGPSPRARARAVPLLPWRAPGPRGRGGVGTAPPPRRFASAARAASKSCRRERTWREWCSSRSRSRPARKPVCSTSRCLPA